MRLKGRIVTKRKLQKPKWFTWLHGYMAKVREGREMLGETLEEQYREWEEEWSQTVIPKLIEVRFMRRLIGKAPLVIGWGLYHSAYQGIFTAKPGSLSWYLLGRIALKNLKQARTRTFITVGAIGVGTAAMVALVSLGYGLQGVVTDRLLHPKAMRLMDVQSDSTALTLDSASIEQLKSLGGITDIQPVITLAGMVSLNESRTEAVVIAAKNLYFDYAASQLVEGKWFSDEANRDYTALSDEITSLAGLLATDTGVVMGVEEAKTLPDKTVTIRIRDERYVPVRAQPETSAAIIGYVPGGVTGTYTTDKVLGGVYETAGVEGKAYVDEQGGWHGYWLKGTFPLWQETAPTVYSSSDHKGEGYITYREVVELSGIEAEVAELDSRVLGISSASAELEALGGLTALGSTEAGSLVVTQDVGGTNETTALMAMLNGEDASASSAQGASADSPATAVVSVNRATSKEVLVSTGLLSLWKLNPNDVIGKQTTLTYIISGGMVSGAVGRVLSEPVDYSIVGVIKDNRPLVYAPLGDIASMGVVKYSMAKVLTQTDEALAGVREKIESLGFVTRSLVDTLRQIDRLFRVMRFLLGSVGMIALVVALLGMFNTLTVSLLERTREVGVMKAIGTTNRDVVRLYLVESVSLGLIGGMVGIAGGILIGMGINVLMYLVRGGEAVKLFATPLPFLLLMLLLSVGVGLITGIYPARRAVKISALNALRYE